VGGRGGQIIEVTNLNADGPGSFRAACEASGPRIVVFRVAGIINLEGRRITITNPYITIAGQTAPEGGIIIKGHEICIKTHDVIIRYIRVRTGRNDSFGYQEGDAISLESNCYNVIIDHCSVSWSNDENMQIWPGQEASHNITISWNLISEGLNYSHPGCGLIVGSDGDELRIHDISIHHNMFMHGTNRFPLVRCRDVRIINNLIYNWKWWPTGTQGGTKVDIIGNKYKMGPDTPSGNPSYEVWVRNDSGPIGDPSIYIKGNLGPHQSNPDGDNWVMLMENQSWTPLGHPPNRAKCERLTPLVESTIPITIHSVTDIEDVLLTDVGASKRLDQDGYLISNHDAVDERLVQEYINGTGQLPYDEDSVSGFPTIAQGAPYTDSDHDGMPDAWETTYGFNPDDPSDGPQDADNDGYTNIEEFLNGTCPDDQSFNFYFSSVNSLNTVSPIAIDGILSEEAWSQAKYVTFSNPSRSENHVKVYTLWDNNYLYFAYEVKDSDLEAIDRRLWEDDGAEIFVDTENDKTASINANDYQLLFNINDKTQTEGANVKTAITPDGYTMEISIPWISINTTPFPGKIMGLLVGNNDRDNGTSVQFDWLHLVETDRWAMPNLWGNIVLSDKQTGSGSPPVINSFTATPSGLANPGDQITFDVDATDPDHDSMNYTIDFGDGAANGSGTHTVHTYRKEGNYVAEVTVDDGHGNTVTKSIQITVNNRPPSVPTDVTTTI
jgi:hypothetical protein